MSYRLVAMIVVLVVLAVTTRARADDDHISTGAEALLRIDGEGRGFAAGLGVAVAASDALELELAGLRSAVWGAYLGARYRFLSSSLRPYAAAGVPMFFFTDDAGAATTSFGVRAAAGLELVIDRHVSVVGDLGVEHFFNVGDIVYGGQRLEPTVFVPTVGLIGRM